MSHSTKNGTSSFNGPRLPEDIFVYIATFFKRDLITATAVCQHWRTVLLSSPLLWRNAAGSSSEIEAYIERSKSTPFDAELSHPSQVDLILPHTSRLVGLTLLLDKVPGTKITHFVERLHYPIPTLHTFRISAASSSHRRWLRSDFKNPFYLHSKTLKIDGLSSSFHGPFPHVTELAWHTPSHIAVENLWRTLSQLPSLERAHITLRGVPICFDTEDRLKFTLSHVLELSISTSRQGGLTSEDFSKTLRFLRVPKLEKLCVQTFRWPPVSTNAHLISRTFPNFAQLPELQVDLEFCEMTFRNPSRATLKYCKGGLAIGKSKDKTAWIGLLLRSVQRLIVNNIRRPDQGRFEDTWLAGLLGNPDRLEYLELEGECDDVIEWLCGREISSQIQTLTIRCGKHEGERAYRLKCQADLAGLATTVICIPGPTSD